MAEYDDSDDVAPVFTTLLAPLRVLGFSLEIPPLSFA
jgi:hypothetical protein